MKTRLLDISRLLDRMVIIQGILVPFFQVFPVLPQQFDSGMAKFIFFFMARKER